MATKCKEFEDKVMDFLIAITVPNADRLPLFQVIRQKDPELIRAINELCSGTPSEETERFLRSLQRPLSLPPETRLVGTNFDADYINTTLLDDMPGEVSTYKSIDEG